MTSEKEKLICNVCGTTLIPAGTSNQIEGCRYHGLEEPADTEWVVCPESFWQCPKCGDWYNHENNSNIAPICGKCEA